MTTSEYLQLKSLVAQQKMERDFLMAEEIFFCITTSILSYVTTTQEPLFSTLCKYVSIIMFLFFVLNFFIRPPNNEKKLDELYKNGVDFDIAVKKLGFLPKKE
jgi:hypothetical protein